MKRYGNLFQALASWENLLLAVHKAARGKRFRGSVAKFCFDYERELLRLQHELNQRTYRPGPYRTFTIYEPKRRIISAAPFRDRVVHHAFCNVVEPIFERTFINDSYVCRRGKGTHAALRRCQAYMRRFRYVLKADIRQFFPSVDHRLLKARVARKIKDPDVKWLVGTIIDHSNPQYSDPDWFSGDDLFTPCERPRGIPIGNQSSQFLANVYLDALDHFVQDHLRVEGYVRYVDDFLAFADEKSCLLTLRKEISEFLGRQLRLRMHPDKSVVFPVSQGVAFLGERVFPSRRLLSKRNVKRCRHRLARLQRQFAAGELSTEQLRQHVCSWLGHAQHANTWQLCQRLSREFRFTRQTATSRHRMGS